MKRILLSIDNLNYFNQTETSFFDLIEYFVSRDWQVDVMTKVISRYWFDRLEAIDQQKSIRYIFQNDLTLQSEYHLIWIFQGYVTEALNDAFHRGKMKGNVIFQHFENYADIDLPYGADLENKLACYSLACSVNAYGRLMAKGIAQEHLKVFPLSVTSEFCNTPLPHRVDLQRAFFIHDDNKAKFSSLTEAFAAHHIELDTVNIDSAIAPITAEALAQYQLIITTGRHVVQALSMGLPVVVATSGHSLGYVNAESLDRLNEAGFMFSSAYVIKDAKNWVDGIVEQWPKASQWAKTFCPTACKLWHLESMVDQLLMDLSEPKTLQINSDEYRRFELHSKVIESLGNDKFTLNGWLEDRKPSQTRVAILNSFIQSYPELGEIAVVIIDSGNNPALVDATLHSLETQLLAPCSLTVLSEAQQYLSGDVKFLPITGGISRTLNHFAMHSSYHGVLIVEAGVVLENHALLVYAEHCLREPHKPAWYCDDLTVGDGSLCLKPDCDIDLLRSLPYVGKNLFFTREIINSLGGFNESYEHLASLDLCWRIIEQKGPDALGHITEVLLSSHEALDSWIKHLPISQEFAVITNAHLERCNVTATLTLDEVSGLHWVTYAVPAQPLVSIIIPTRDRAALLKQCIDSLISVTRYSHYEIIVVDNRSQEDDARQYLEQLAIIAPSQVKVLRYDSAFNFAAMNNQAASIAKGEVLLFLNNDIQLIEPDWLDALLQQAMRPEVGIVGARLEFPDGRIEHGGFVTGVDQGVQNTNYGAGQQDSGFLFRLKTVRGARSTSAK